MEVGAGALRVLSAVLLGVGRRKSEVEDGCPWCGHYLACNRFQATSNPARWVLAVREDSPVRRAEDLAGTIIASELMETTKQ
jgi:hypothetical protein